jgi:predicted naringenin-chalcone synthase
LSGLHLVGIGTAVPEHQISQDDAAQAASGFERQGSSPALLTRLYRRSGVLSRHSVVLESSTNGDVAKQSFYLPAESCDDRGPFIDSRMQRYEKEAGPLGLTAARRALLNSGTEPHEVTHLISVSCTGFASPGFDIELCRQLPLRATVARTHIGFMGCHALLNALRAAHAYVKADPQAVVLICAVELCSLHQQYGGGSDRIVSNALFADGAAAIVGRVPKRDDSSRLAYVAGNSLLLPDTLDQMTWKVRNHGFEMTLSPHVPELIRERLRSWLEPWLKDQGVSREQVRHWAVHPGGPRILDAISSAMELNDNALATSRKILENYGNMSSPTVAFVLERLDYRRAPGPTVLLAFGPGLTMEAALLHSSSDGA